MSFISLDGDWQLTSPQNPEVVVPMMLPGDNHHALVSSAVIPHPYYATNETSVQWVAQCDWHIERTFIVTDDDLDCEALELVISRVDTLASVWINGERVLSCSNMFQQYRVDIKGSLCLGENRIEVRFDRADLEAERRAKEQPFFVPWAVGNNQVPYMNLLRKTQCHSGWDWGICLVVCGIYDSILIERILHNRIESASTHQYWQDDGSVRVAVEVRYEAKQQTALEVSLGGQTRVEQVTGQGCAQLEFNIENPELWWPSGYGEQPLYALQVALGEKKLCRKLGLRRLELNTDRDEIGSAMEFRVNGFPISARGANWIPMDAMPSLESESRYRQLLQSAVDANMNMIRVWGGGQYESDCFYDLCDEMGLLVWQDLMFACALYPSTPAFISDVEREVRQQIRRLREHACIAIWCGDNEVIGALTWYDESKANRDRYVVNYDRLSRALSNIISVEDPSRVFWPSSPCNGDLDYGDAWHDDNKGDMHFWDVWHSNASFDAYLGIQPRFCSEFGFQSWPSLAEVKAFVPEEDWNITSPTFESHQKNGRGNSIITEMFTRYFRFPKSFEQMLYLSQVQQAIAIKTGCEYWRAMSPTCRGLLYWQLNDSWPVSSWSSIEYSGRWKQLHYHTRRFFSPTYGAFVLEKDVLRLNLINERRESGVVTGVIRQLSWSGVEQASWPFEHKVEADSNQTVLELKHPDVDGFIHLELEAFGEKVENTWFPSSEFKRLGIKKARLEWSIEGNRVLLKTDMPAFFVHLECDGNGRFSDSSFTLVDEAAISYEGDEADLKGLRVYHLANSY